MPDIIYNCVASRYATRCMGIYPKLQSLQSEGSSKPEFMENHHPTNLQYSNSAYAASIQVDFTVIWIAFEYDHELSVACFAEL